MLDSVDAGEGSQLCALVADIARLLPGEVGLLIADELGRLQPVTAGAGPADELFRYEERNTDGPCGTCYRTGRATISQPVRFASSPRYAALAQSSRFGYVTALPLRYDATTVGVVGVLHMARLTGVDSSLARTLAKFAAASILQQRALKRSALKVEQLQRALDSRVQIEQAKGAVAAKLSVTPSAAFELLRQYARRHNLKLADVAGMVFSTDIAERLLDDSRPVTSPGPANP